jgi:hypothetical protein
MKSRRETLPAVGIVEKNPGSNAHLRALLNECSATAVPRGLPDFRQWVRYAADIDGPCEAPRGFSAAFSRPAGLAPGLLEAVFLRIDRHGGID